MFRRHAPRLSIVVVVHRMPEQAERTLRSLAPPYQRGVASGDYEVIVVENRSDRLLGAERVAGIAPNLRYLLREEPLRTPVNAIEAGVAEARAPHVAVMIDGARMLTPGVVGLALQALAMDPGAVVSVPGYHIGEQLQQVAVNSGYDEAAEAVLMQRIGWPQDGYRLFEIAVFSGSCRRGFFLPAHESNFIAISRAKWRAAGGMDRRYDDFGGGMANLDLYKRLLELPGTPLYLLFGEGSFHQFHGGVTTGTPRGEREEIMRRIRAQDAAIRGERTGPPAAQPILFGAAHPAVHRFLRQSLDSAGAP
jgi:hypothetical protein